MAAIHRLDDERSAGDTVPGSENPLSSGSQGVRVDGNCLLSGQPHAGVVRDEGQTGSLSDREDDGIAGQRVLTAGYFLDVQVAGGVEGEGGDILAAHPAHVARIVAEDCLEAPAGMEVYAFRRSRFNFPPVGRHLLAALQAGQMDLPPQAEGSARTIDRHVASAQNQHALAQPIAVLLQPTQAHVAQEMGVDQHALQLRARNR